MVQNTCRGTSSEEFDITKRK